MPYAFTPPDRPSIAIVGRDERFPVHRIYCVGRNFAEHAREMGAEIERGTPVFFAKPADAVVAGGGDLPYPPGTRELHHEVELVVALGVDAAPGPIDRQQAADLVFGYTVGVDLTRRDLQARAKEKGLPWDTAKGFDCSAPVAALLPLAQAQAIGARRIWLEVNGQLRQQATLDTMVWDVPSILCELSQLYVLRAGDLVFMGTPAGVGPLLPGDRFRAGIDGWADLQGRILAR